MFGLNWTRPSPRAMIVKNNLVKSFWNATTTLALPELGKETSLLLFDTSFPPISRRSWVGPPLSIFSQFTREVSSNFSNLNEFFLRYPLIFFGSRHTSSNSPKEPVSTFQLSRLTSWVEMGRTLRFHWKMKKHEYSALARGRVVGCQHLHSQVCSWHSNEIWIQMWTDFNWGLHLTIVFFCRIGSNQCKAQHKVIQNMTL